MMNKHLIQLVGWYGVGAIIVAYALVSFSLVSSQSIAYQLLNLTGALGIIIETYFKKDSQPLILNIFWFIIAALAIFQILTNR